MNKNLVIALDNLDDVAITEYLEDNISPEEYAELRKHIQALYVLFREIHQPLPSPTYLDTGN